MIKSTTIAGRYRLEEPIATGGMGTVWRAKDEVLERYVAVKVLNETLAQDPSASERFRREALTAASITHPNMANVYDYVEEDGRPGIVMELVDGETLAHLIARDGRLPISEAVRIASDVLLALQTAHNAGIVHRDIKPGNILLTPVGEVKVGDFGIARSLSDASITVTGTVMGTAHYSAPEQVRGEAASPVSDVYATGIVLYEMLTGERPFRGDTAMAVAMARLNGDPTPPHDLRPAIPRSVNDVVLRALARDPKARFASAVEMRGALTEGAGGLDTLLPTTTYPVGADAETLSFTSPVPIEPKEQPPIGREYIPPRWAGRKVATVLIPLLALGLLAFLVVGAVGSEKVTPKAPAASPSPSVAVPACCVVPEVRGLTLKDAKIELAMADLEPGQVVERATNVRDQDGKVVAQSPAPNETLSEGSAVTLYVGKFVEDRPGKGRKKHGND